MRLRIGSNPAEEAIKRNTKVVVTGGAGFLGSHVVEELKNRGYEKIFVPRKMCYNLIRQTEVERLFKDTRPDIVIHLAGSVGGIGANQENPGKFFYENMIMGVNLIQEAAKQRVQKFVNIGTVCSYPKNPPIPFKEEDIWEGFPEETNAPYGVAKRSLSVMLQAYKEQYGLNSITLIPTNLYGPGDNFGESSHVIPALIKKIDFAKKNSLPEIEVWGTGQATREFLYVKDAANYIVDGMEFWSDPNPVNVGNGQEVSISDLVVQLCGLMDYEKNIFWNTSKPDGQPRRCLDITRLSHFPNVFNTPLQIGLQETINWYRND